MIPLLRLIAAVATVSIGLCPLRAQSPQDASNQAATAVVLDQGNVLKAAAEVTTERYPDANVVLVDGLTRIKYLNDGSYTERNESYRKVLTEKGRTDSLTDSKSYDAFYSELKVATVEILRPDGSVVALDPAKQAKEMVESAQMSANIYNPNEKRVTVSVPGVQIGDMVHLVWEEKANRARFPKAFFNWFTFENTAPIRHEICEISGPKDMPLRKTALLHAIAGTVRSSEAQRDGENVYVWEASNVPQYFPEAEMPSIGSCGQHVLVSTIPDWETVSRWYWQVSLPHLEKTTDAMRAMVKDLLKGATTPDQKIRRIFDFVSHHVRYMGITTETTFPGYEPHDVCITFDNRYGVCRDKAALLAAMLRLAGFDASPVLIKGGDKLDQDVPLPYFNHAITGIRQADGSYSLMDPTDENTVDIFPSYLQDCSYLVARKDGETLAVSPVISPESNLMVANTKAAIADDGSIAGETELHFNGINDNAYRSALVRLKPEDIRRMFETIFKDRLPEAVISELEISPKNLGQTDQPLVAKIKFQAPNFLVTTGGKAFADTQFFGASFGVASEAFGKNIDLEKRRFPIHLGMTCGVREHFSVTLPPSIGQTLALPEEHKIATPTLRYSRKVTRDGLTLQGDLDLQITQPEIPAEAYAGLKKNIREMEYANRERPIFAAARDPGTPADVRFLEKSIRYRVKDAHTWTEALTVRKKILTYAGKIANSELRISYNPAWTTIDLEYARVILPDGTVKEVQPQEKNLMDASWTASAPRYPAEKQLVVSFPGVDVGATIEYALTYSMRDRPFFSARESFFGFDPADKSTVSIQAPESLKLAVKENADLVKKSENGTSDYSATQSYEAAAKEPSLPPAETFMPTIQVSSMADDGDYAKVVAAAVRPLALPTDAVEKKAASLIQNCKNDREKVIALRDFVARETRNAGPNFTKLPLANLSPAETTLKDGYGNNADRAILLQALLQAAKLDSALFLTTATPAASVTREENAPLQHGYYANLAVRATVAGESLWLDDLSQYAELGTTALENCMALPLDGSAPFKILAGEAFRNREEIHYAIAVEANGDALVTVTENFPGNSFTNFKREFTEITPEQLRRYHQECLAWISPSAESAADLSFDFTYPGKLQYAARVKNFAVITGNYLYFDLPGSMQRVCDAVGNTRKEPFFYGKAETSHSEWVMNIPTGFKINTLPETCEWEGPGELGRVKLATHKQHDIDGKETVQLVADVRLKPAIIPPASYASLLDINSRLSKPASWRVLFEKQ